MSKRSGRRKTAKKAGVAIGVAWYRREDWPKLLAASVDRDQLEDTYDEWISFAERQLQRAAAEGFHVEKVDLDMDKLIAWCRDRQVPLDGDARADYVSAMMLQRG